jgi:hypothetical protein
MLDHPDWILQRTSEDVKGSPPFQGNHKEYRALQSVFSLPDVEEVPLPLVRHVESNEVIGLIPYLSPELIAAILKRQSLSSVDLQADSKSAAENSFSALRSQSAVNEKPVRIPFRRKVSWLRRSRLFAVVGRLVAPWFP